MSGDGNWFVGGELGLLRFSKNHGRTWESIRGNIPFGTVLELGQWDDQIIATTIRGKDVYIHAAKAGTAEWRQLARYAGAQGVRTESFVVGDALITTLPQDGKVAYLEGCKALRRAFRRRARLSGSEGYERYQGQRPKVSC